VAIRKRRPPPFIFLPPDSAVDFEVSQTLDTSSGDFVVTSRLDDASQGQCDELLARYGAIIQGDRQSWTAHLRFEKLLGSGGQGRVFLSQRRGADQFTLPVALKIFSPERYPSPEIYDVEMARSGRVAAKVARIQHDNLLVVQDFLDRERIRMMVMEWIEGFDLRRLLTPAMLGRMEARFSKKRWEYVNRVLVTRGEVQPRFKPGIAVAIVRDCLAALAALHRAGIVHADVKPANIMLKRSGRAKIIDIGSAFELDELPPRRACTPAYAAPEVLEGDFCGPLSDLASLGYVLVELLAGRPVFSGIRNLPQLIEAKLDLPDRLSEYLPGPIADDDLLMSFCLGLVDPNPDRRFPSAEAAELVEDVSAAAFHRHLVKDDLSSEYENDIRIWIEELLEMEEFDGNEEETQAME
jgi:serine/threonine-protein kinase